METPCTAGTESLCIRHTELPDASRLFTDLLYDFGRVAQFYDYDPSGPESLSRSAARVDFPDDRRKTIARILEDQNGGSQSVELLRRPGTVAVVTGQQVGLFGGPCYTVYKALTAVALARRLRGLGVNAVPIFWMATEDHDFEEVNHCWVFDERNSPARLEIAASAAKNAPVGGIPIGRAPIEELRAGLAGLPYADDAIAAVVESYTPGRAFGSAFGALLKRIVGDRDLLFFDPMDQAARRLAAPLMARAVENAPALVDALLRRNRELQHAGYHAQVKVDACSALVFLLQEGERLTLRRDGNGYVAGSRRIPSGELAARSEALSPNALLRPVVQDYLFPTAAYVGGPAELAYFAQNQVIYRELIGRSPMVVPRGTATILDAQTQGLLVKNGLRLPDLCRPEHLVKERLSAAFLPVQIASEIGETRLAVARLFEQTGAGRGASAGDARWLAKSRTKVEYQLSKVERRVARERMAADKRATAAATAACNLVYPSGHLQERFYSILPFLARHGFGLMDILKEEMGTSGGLHKILVC